MLDSMSCLGGSVVAPLMPVGEETAPVSCVVPVTTQSSMPFCSGMCVSPVKLILKGGAS